MSSAEIPARVPPPAAPSPKPERLGYIDTLRGALLVIMAVNHIPSDVQAFTNHFLGFISGAEGFVFMSGLMCGYVYSRRYYKFGAAELKEAAARRARTTYLYHIATFVAVLVGLLGYRAYFGATPPSASPYVIDHPLAALVSSLALLQQPSLFDILPLYCIFLLALPFVILTCARGNRRAIVIGSFAVWGAVNLFSPQKPLIAGFVNTGSFNLLAWQLLFVVGAVFGHAWSVKQRLIPSVRWLTVTLGLLIAATLFCVRHAFVHLPLPTGWLDWMTNKNNLAPLRAINVAVVFYLIYALAQIAPRLLTWRPLAFLGQHSIFVFAMHILVAYTIQTFPEYFQQTATGRWIGTTLMIGGLFAAAEVHRRALARARERERPLGARQDRAAGASVGG